MSTLGQKLKKLRAEKEGESTQKVVAATIGCTRDTYANWENDRGEPDNESLKRLANCYNVSTDYLLGHIDTKIPISEAIKYAEQRNQTKNVRIIENPDIVSLPLVGTVAAGTPIFTEENIEGYIDFPKPLAKNATFALKVRGDSMEGVNIHDGDILFVKQQNTADNGQIVIARIEGEVTCKRLYRANGKVVLEPANGKYKPIEPDKLEIVGIVVSVTRIF